MQAQKSFPQRAENQIRYILYFLAIQIGLVLIGVISALLTKKFNNAITVITVFLSLILLVVFIVWILSSYNRIPIVHEKSEVSKEQKRLTQGIASIQKSLRDCVTRRSKITADEELEVKSRQAKHATTLDNLQQKRSSLSVEQNNRLSSELSRIQKEHVSIGLKNSLLSNAKIPGIGPALKDRLRANGIATAFDVSYISIRDIPGIGDAKKQQLAFWRDSIESHLNRTKPTGLPPNIAEKIQSYYMAQNRQIDSEEALEHNNFKIDLIQIQTFSLQKYRQNDEDENLFNQHQQELLDKKLIIDDIYNNYSDITFLNFSKSLLANLIPNRQKASSLKAPFVIGLLALILSQCYVGLQTTKSAVISLIPTSTFTSTPTPTFTLTFTPTPTSTPTFTPTPTETPTPTLTPTPSLTPTPTVTRTPTNTSTPTVTLQAIINGDCIPLDTKREIGIVKSITDGDTIVVEINGLDYKVRYIGVDSPEPSTGALGVTASNANRDLVLGKNVTLIKDVSEVDKYDRLLRYVVVGNTFVNEYLVRIGMAKAVAYPPDITCNKALQETQSNAEANYYGMWSSTYRNPGILGIIPTTVSSGSTGGSSPTAVNTGLCNCSIDYDCADFSSHWQAQACFESCGGSTSYNWSRLDGDGDGSACEALP